MLDPALGTEQRRAAKQLNFGEAYGLKSHQKGALSAALRGSAELWLPEGLGKGYAVGDFIDQVTAVRTVVGKSKIRKDACESLGDTPFPDYEDFYEALDDLVPVAAACAQRGGTLCWPAWADRRKRRSLHLIWVAKVAKIRLRDVKRLLKRTKRPSR